MKYENVKEITMVDFLKELNTKEVFESLTYPEIRKKVSNNHVVFNQSEMYQYFVLEIYPRMLEIIFKKNNNKNEDNVEAEFSIFNQFGILIFALPTTPFAKFYLSSSLERAEEYQEFLDNLIYFITKYQIGNITHNKFSVSLNFKGTKDALIKAYYMEKEEIQNMTINDLKIRQRTTDNN